jgi:hypothetical protein
MQEKEAEREKKYRNIEVKNGNNEQRRAGEGARKEIAEKGERRCEKIKERRNSE